MPVFAMFLYVWIEPSCAVGASFFFARSGTVSVALAPTWPPETGRYVTDASAAASLTATSVSSPRREAGSTSPARSVRLPQRSRAVPVSGTPVSTMPSGSPAKSAGEKQYCASAARAVRPMSAHSSPTSRTHSAGRGVEWLESIEKTS